MRHLGTDASRGGRNGRAATSSVRTEPPGAYVLLARAYAYLPTGYAVRHL